MKKAAAKNVFGKLLPLASFTVEYQSIANAALDVQQNAYAPYSNFLVGAALLHTDESITAGCNWENCIYQGTCAERCAIVSANAKGKRISTAVAVCGGSNNEAVKAPPTSLVTPCGLCRQMLKEVSELSVVDLDVLLIAANRTHAKLMKLSELLPEGFGPADIGVDLKVWGKDRTSVVGKKRSRDA